MSKTLFDMIMEELSSIDHTFKPIRRHGRWLFEADLGTSTITVERMQTGSALWTVMRMTQPDLFCSGNIGGIILTEAFQLSDALRIATQLPHPEFGEYVELKSYEHLLDYRKRRIKHEVNLVGDGEE